MRIEIDPQRERAELREYLGHAYDEDRLRGYAAQLDAERAAHPGDDASFYRVSEAYLYDLTAFAMTQTKQPYLDALVAEVPAGARLLDWGCGIGSDGLALLEAGFDVCFADFDNPSTRYLRWRLAHRGLIAEVVDLDREAVPSGFAAAYAFDVLEHVDDPFALLADLEARAALVVVNVLEPEPGETSLHRELPVAELIAHAASHCSVFHRLLHGRSHLLGYRPRVA